MRDQAHRIDNTNRHISLTWHWFASSVLILFITYPLSIGPVSLLRDKQVIPEKVVDVVYAPLDKLSQQSHVVGRLVWSYIWMWSRPVAVL